jgi:hypothetical protein
MSVAIQISDAWGNTSLFADVVHEQERLEYSQLLGPDGKHLRYVKPRLGFDLRPNQCKVPDREK